jgi:hypothetical protein
MTQLNQGRYAARAKGTPHFYVAPWKRATDKNGKPIVVPAFDGDGDPPACRACGRSRWHIVHLTPGAPWP